MKLLWNAVNRLPVSKSLKHTLFLLLNTLLFGLLGFLVWLIVRTNALDTLTHMILFIGYPAMFLGFYGGIITLFVRCA